jgi:hypothetical protein
MADWATLVRLPRPHSTADVQELFYPSAPLEALEDLKLKGQLYRRPKFLAGLESSSYYHAYQSALELPQDLLDVPAFLRTSRSDGRTVSQVMCHVVQWLNPHPSKIADRENNKPPWWREFVTPLRASFGDQAEVQSRELQRQIFAIVRDRIDELTKGNAGSYLSRLPSEGEAYLERFGSPIWKDILIATHSIVGPNFQGLLLRFNTQDPKSLPSQAESTTLVQAVDQAIRRIPEITLNPAFQNPVALEALMAHISPLISDWASKQCREALAAQNSNQAPCWPPSALEAIQSQSEKQERPPIAQRTAPQNSSNVVPLLPAQGEDLLQGPQARSVGALNSVRGDSGQDSRMAVLAKANSIVIDQDPDKAGLSAQDQPAHHNPLPLKQKPKPFCQRDQPLPAQQGARQISTGAPSPNLLKHTRSWKQGPKARAGSSQRHVRVAVGKYG